MNGVVKTFKVSYFLKHDSDYLKHVNKHQLDVRYVKDSVKDSTIHHSFIPRKSELEMRIISADLTHSSKVPLSTTNAKNISDFNPGMYVPCIYDSDWYIGIISETSVEFDKMYVKFMKQEGRVSCVTRGMMNVGFQFLIPCD